MIIKDDRDEAQQASHTTLVVATDSFMSGWGGATGGKSYAAWACEPQHREQVFSWVRNRSDMKRARVVANDYRPGHQCKHYHIYVVTEGHPALQQED